MKYIIKNKQTNDYTYIHTKCEMRKAIAKAKVNKIVEVELI